MAKKSDDGPGMLMVFNLMLGELRKLTAGQEATRKELKAEIGSLRVELKEEVGSLRQETRTGFRALTKAMKRRDVSTQETSTEVGDLRERVEQLEAAVFREK